MKELFFVGKFALLSLAAVVALASCNKDEAAPTLTVDPSAAIVFTAAAAESHTITVTTNVASWDAVSDQAWCIVTKESGKFKVTATANAAPTAPTPAKITVSAEGTTPVIISVTQEAAPTLTVDPSAAIVFTAAATESHTITVTTNVAAWNAVSDQTWCIVTKESGKFTITATANAALRAPTPAKITVSAEGTTPVIISVTQEAAPTLTVDPSAAIVFTAAATESHTITVTTNVAAWNAVSDQTWCIVTKESGKFTITATNNAAPTSPAPAKITVSAEGTTPVIIDVTQAAATPTLAVDPSAAIVFTAAATENHTITVTTNVASWDAVSDQTWCIVTKESGKFTITATNNAAPTSPAPAKITVSAEGTTPVIIDVTQAAKVITPSVVITEGAGAPRIFVSGTGDDATLQLTKEQNYNATYFQFGGVIGFGMEASVVPVFNSTNTEITTWNADWDSDAVHSVENLKAGKGDPCRLVGYKASQVKAMLVANILPDNGVWRTPTNAENGVFSTENRRPNWNIISTFNGHYFPTATSTTNWLPASGSRDGASGAFGFVGSVGYYWSSSVMGVYGYHLAFVASEVYPATTNNRASGFPVRCVQQ